MLFPTTQLEQQAVDELVAELNRRTDPTLTPTMRTRLFGCERTNDGDAIVVRLCAADLGKRTIITAAEAWVQLCGDTVSVLQGDPRPSTKVCPR